MTSITESKTPEQTFHKRFLWTGLTALAVVFIAAALFWTEFGNRSSEQELATKASLAKLGALVVMDSDRKHVVGVNLSTLHATEMLGQAIEVLPALGHLKSINADHTDLNDEHLEVIGQLTSLEDLVLSHTAITDAGLARLVDLRNVKSLHLTETALTNASVANLAKFRALSILDISGTKITGDLGPICGLNKLNWLVARRLTLDAAAVAAIANCSGLHRLSLNDTNCPRDAVVKLAQKRPDLTIDR